jgi:hypothetical protein
VGTAAVLGLVVGVALGVLEGDGSVLACPRWTPCSGRHPASVQVKGWAVEFQCAR